MDGLVRALPMQAQGNRIDMQWDPILTEWWVNRAVGLEQGFTLAQAPPAGLGPLRVEMALDTKLTPELADDSQALVLRDAAGNVALHYAKLVVVDATGRTLPAWMALEKAAGATPRLQLVVDAQNARYPLTIDPLVSNQVAKLTAGDGAAGDEFGWSVAVAGDTIVIGAWKADVGGTFNRGAAYVFARTQGGADSWGQVAKLIASDGAQDDNFGHSVTIEGDNIVVGAWKADVDGNFDRGAAYVFARPGRGRQLGPGRQARRRRRRPGR